MFPIAPQVGTQGMQMNFVAGRALQYPCFNLDKALCREPVADSPGDRRALAEDRPAVLVAVLVPPGRGLRRNRHQQNRLSELSLGQMGLASARQIRKSPRKLKSID